MSLKTVLLLIVIILTGTFIFLKIQVLGNPNSTFNQTTRLSLGKHALVRDILGMHSYGDARGEYFFGKGDIEIRTFKGKISEADISVVKDFAKLVTKYTGRQTKVVAGSPIDDSAINKETDLRSGKLFSGSFGSTQLLVFFSEDYKPRGAQELSTTYEESGILVSLKAHQDFLRQYNGELNNYLLSSLLHEFGHQLGLEHNSDPDCIMEGRTETNDQPLEIFVGHTPTDFCAAEKEQIQRIKLKLENN